MLRTFRSSAIPQKKPALTSATRRANVAILAVSTLLAACFGVGALQQQNLIAENRQAAEAYAPAVTYVPPPDAIEVAFLGDSFTAGTKASSKSQRWTSLLSSKLGWSELNYGEGGTNYNSDSPANGGAAYAERITDIVHSHPDIVIVSTAGNRMDLQQDPGIKRTFRELRDGLPNARIIATSPYYRASQFPSEFDGFASAIEREVEAVGGEYLDIGHPLLNKPELVSEDGVHPNDAGYRTLTDVIEKRLEDAGVTNAEGL